MNRTYRVGNGTLGAFGLAALTGLGGMWLLMAGDDAGAGVIVAVVGGMAVLFGLILAWLVRAATVVDAGGITVRGLFRTRHLAWGDIQELTVELNPNAWPARTPPPRRCTRTTGRPFGTSSPISTPRA